MRNPIISGVLAGFAALGEAFGLAGTASAAGPTVTTNLATPAFDRPLTAPGRLPVGLLRAGTPVELLCTSDAETEFGTLRWIKVMLMDEPAYIPGPAIRLPADLTLC